MLFPYFELAASLFILLLCFHIYTRHYENRAARIFARFALIAFLACILTYSMRIAFTLELAQTINRLSTPLFAFTFSLFAHFTLVFTKRDRFLKHKINLLWLYLSPALLSILFLFTNHMYIRYEIINIGIISQPAPLYFLFMLHTIFYVSWGIILLLINSYKAPQKSVRFQSMVIAVGSAIPAIVGVATDEFLPLLQGRRIFYPTCVFDVAVMCFFIYLAMRRYSLFAISPALAADVIIETMPSSMIVTDLDGRILLLNQNAQRFFKVPSHEITGKLACELFKSRADFDKLYEDLIEKNLEVERFEAHLIDPHGEMIPSLINANKIHDALGATLGIVFIIRDIRG